MSDRARADNFQISKAIALWSCLDNLPAVPGCIHLLESSSWIFCSSLVLSWRPHILKKVHKNLKISPHSREFACELTSS